MCVCVLISSQTEINVMWFALGDLNERAELNKGSQCILICAVRNSSVQFSINTSTAIDCDGSRTLKHLVRQRGAFIFSEVGLFFSFREASESVLIKGSEK